MRESSHENLPWLQKNIVTEEIIAVGKSAFEMIGRTPEKYRGITPNERWRNR